MLTVNIPDVYLFLSSYSMSFSLCVLLSHVLLVLNCYFFHTKPFWQLSLFLLFFFSFSPARPLACCLCSSLGLFLCVFMCFYMWLLVFVLVCFWFLHKPDVCMCLCVLLVLWSQSSSQYRTSFSSVPASSCSGTIISVVYVNIDI